MRVRSTVEAVLDEIAARETKPSKSCRAASDPAESISIGLDCPSTPFRIRSPLSGLYRPEAPHSDEDDVRPLGSRHLAALLAVLCRQHLEIAEQFGPHLEHVDAVVVVFDVKHFGHDASSVPLLTAVRVWASRRIRSTRSAG